MRCRVTHFDVAPAARSVEQAVDAAMFVTCENILSDCTPHVPVRSGALRGSGKVTRHTDAQGTIEWGTDADTAKYARTQYHGNFNHPNQPGVQSPAKWFEVAAASSQQRWVDMFGHELKARL